MSRTGGLPRIVGLLALAPLPLVCAAATFEEGVALERQRNPEAAAQVFAQVVQQDPSNRAAREQLAIVLDVLQRYDESIGLWRALVAESPTTGHYHLGLGRVYMDQGRPDDAKPELEKALGLQSSGPEDEYEAAMLAGDIAVAENDPDSAREAYATAAAMPLARGDQELAGKIARLPKRLANRFDFGGVADRYSHERGNESSWLARYAYEWESGQILYLRLDRQNHFHTVDSIVSAGGFIVPNDDITVQLEAGVSQDPQFSPAEQGLINVDWTRWWIQPLIGLRYLHYPDGYFRVVSPGVRFIHSFLGDLEVRYEMSKDIDGTHSAITEARSSWVFGPRHQFAPYITGSIGKDALPPEDPAKVKRLGAGIAWDFSARWGVHVDYAYEERRHDYILHSAALGFTMRF